MGTRTRAPAWFCCQWSMLVSNPGVITESLVRMFREVLQGMRKTSEKSRRIRKNEMKLKRKKVPQAFFSPGNLKFVK